MNTIKKELTNKILSGNFQEAKLLIQGTLDEKSINLLIDIGYDTENFIVYAFVCFLLREKETIILHQLANEILCLDFFYLVGAYESALSHTRRAIELSPHNIMLAENLLFLHRVPEKVVSDKEARIIAHTMLLTEPNNEVALEKLQRLDQDHEQEIEKAESCAEQTINEALKQEIIAGEFVEAKKKMPVIPLDLLTKLLMEIAYEEESICSYAFVCFLMVVEKESSAYHSLAADILQNALSDITGSPETAQYHRKRAAELLGQI